MATAKQRFEVGDHVMAPARTDVSGDIWEGYVEFTALDEDGRWQYLITRDGCKRWVRSPGEIQPYDKQQWITWSFYFALAREVCCDVN